MSFYFKFKLNDLIDGAPGLNKIQKIRYSIEYLQEQLKAEEAKFKKQEEEKAERVKQQAQQEKLELEIKNLFNNFVTDFNKNPYEDKYYTQNINGGNVFFYLFENGQRIEIYNDGKLVYYTGTNEATYLLGFIWRQAFIKAANDIQKVRKQRPKKENYDWKNYAKFFDDIDIDLDEFIQDFSKWKNNNTTNSTNKQNHPKWKVYQTIIITVNSRTEHLAKLSWNHPDRESLTNELNAAIKRMKEMKEKYNF